MNNGKIENQLVRTILGVSIRLVELIETRRKHKTVETEEDRR